MVLVLRVDHVVGRYHVVHPVHHLHHLVSAGGRRAGRGVGKRPEVNQLPCRRDPIKRTQYCAPSFISAMLALAGNPVISSAPFHPGESRSIRSGIRCLILRQSQPTRSHARQRGSLLGALFSVLAIRLWSTAHTELHLPEDGVREFLKTTVLRPALEARNNGAQSDERRSAAWGLRARGILRNGRDPIIWIFANFSPFP
jgi:hypothetical protein